MSLYQIFGIVMGFAGGITWEKLGTSPFKNIPTITPSLIANFSGKTIHFHHWLVYFALLLIIIFWSAKTGRLLHPSVLMIMAFLISAMAYNFIKFSDWCIFFK